MRLAPPWRLHNDLPRTTPTHLDCLTRNPAPLRDPTSFATSQTDETETQACDLYLPPDNLKV